MATFPHWREWLGAVLLALAWLAPDAARAAPADPGDPAFDRRVAELMQAAAVPGLAVATIRDGRIRVQGYGQRDVAAGLPLETDTVMYAASLTKGVFAYAVMTLVDEGRLDLDRPLAGLLPKPLPDYPKYADLAGDPRWRRITPRMLLSHTAGFPNFRFYTPQGYDENARLFIAFEPGSRFAYSGEGINLLQFVLENGLGIDVGRLMQERVFDRFGMARTSMNWRDDFAGNLALGYGHDGEDLGHRQRGSVRAAGSMDTTPADFARFLAALSQGQGLSADAYRAMLAPRVPITSPQQFPTLAEDRTTAWAGIDLAYALGWAVYETPQGRAFFKGGHDDGTRNLALCVRDGRECVLLLGNSSNAEGIFAALVREALGETCLPWYWENNVPYDRPELRDPKVRQAPPVDCPAPR
jgi:CubicO group peptidase (beta-lactamase class C family)